MKTTALVLMTALTIALTPATLCAREGASVKITELRSEKSPLVTVRIALRAGSVNDPAGKEGLNALTASLIGSGGTRELTYSQVMEKLYPWAANNSSRSGMPAGKRRRRVCRI